MFLAMLTTNEKLAFLSLAYALSNAHDGVSSVEEDIINACVQEMNIQHTNDFMNIEKACENITDTKAKKITILELMLVALADGDYAESEDHIMQKILSKLNIEEDVIEGAKAWAEFVLASYRSGLRFISQ